MGGSVTSRGPSAARGPLAARFTATSDTVFSYLASKLDDHEKTDDSRALYDMKMAAIEERKAALEERKAAEIQRHNQQLGGNRNPETGTRRKIGGAKVGYSNSRSWST